MNRLTARCWDTSTWVDGPVGVLRGVDDLDLAIRGLVRSPSCYQE